jgi:hypothetical protein
MAQSMQAASQTHLAGHRQGGRGATLNNHGRCSAFVLRQRSVRQRSVLLLIDQLVAACGARRAIPAPAPSSAATLSPVWLRLEALKAALKLRVTIRISTREVLGGAQAAGGGGRYPLRDHAPQAKQQQQQQPQEVGWGGRLRVGGCACMYPGT